MEDELNQPKVYNKYKNPPKDAIYIGRGSPYGNPFIIGKHGDRKQVVDMHKQSVLSNLQFMQNVRQNLKGKSLICFCSPAACHGDFLLLIANLPEDEFNRKLSTNTF